MPEAVLTADKNSILRTGLLEEDALSNVIASSLENSVLVR
jgi:hypothetical protein